MGQITVISQFITAGSWSAPKLDKRGNGKDRAGMRESKLLLCKLAGKLWPCLRENLFEAADEFPCFTCMVMIVLIRSCYRMKKRKTRIVCVFDGMHNDSRLLKQPDNTSLIFFANVCFHFKSFLK